MADRVELEQSPLLHGLAKPLIVVEEEEEVPAEEKLFMPFSDEAIHGI
jgi:predicted glycosyltransferase